MFLPINLTNIKRYYNAKLIETMMFALRIVFDCSYENYMSIFEIHNCAKQLTISFADNSTHVDSMCLYYCNLNNVGLLMEYLRCFNPTISYVNFPVIVTSQSYLNLFRKDQLLYFTPHCKTDRTEYNSDTVYIIGAMVDKNKLEPLSLEKTKENGIHMGKLSMKKYLKWGSGSCKNLTIDQMTIILLDLNYTRDWEKALQYMPKRKLKKSRDYKQ